MNPGLSATEAAARLARDGPNTIRRDPPPSAPRILLRQFASPMVTLLLGAAAIAGVTGEALDAVAIAVTLLLIGFVGFAQEYRAERAVHALRALTAPRARVRRDGHGLLVAAQEVVVGDVLLLEAGDRVPADAVVASAAQLQVNEAMLTGESVPVEKADGERVFAGTEIVAGAAEGVVDRVGMATELGRIATLLAQAPEGETPLQRHLAEMSRVLLWACLGVVVVVAGALYLRGAVLLDLFILAASLAVAAVPEGLPAVVTVALALGTRRMAAWNVLVRKLAAVETLGCATVIVTDKTGTLTTGRMTVRELWGPDLDALLHAAAAASDADLDSGDPTEVALLHAAAARGKHRDAIEAAAPRRAVLPFDSVRKRMSIYREDGRNYVKGAPEMVLPLCVAGTEGAEGALETLTHQGLRVLAVALGDHEHEHELRLVGLIGLADPPREEAKQAIRDAHAAGIRVVMATGDHHATATAIAREMGIEHVRARVRPEDKLAIVEEWKRRGEVVAMTGDGVNDAPAIRAAHIGIAMGRSGAEVVREAADMVLTDDNFASIVAAIREGRGIWDNIRKTLVYLLIGNAAELLFMLGTVLAGLPVPLLPLQLLWINLVTDALPALALVADAPGGDVLDRPPRPPQEEVLRRREWGMIAGVAAVEALVAGGVYVWGIEARSVGTAATLAFTTLVLSELFRALPARHPTRSMFQVGVHPLLLGVTLVSALLQVFLLFTPPARVLFSLQEVSLADLGVAAALALVPMLAVDLGKRFLR